MIIFTQRIARLAFAVGLLTAAGTGSAATPLTFKSSPEAETKTRHEQCDLFKSLAAQAERLSGKETDACQLPSARRAAANGNEETLLYMDFSGFEDGSEEELGTEITAGYQAEGNPYIDPSYVNGEEGWWGIGVFSAGGTAALAYPNYGGCIATPMMNLYGNLHVSCRVKVREGNKRGFTMFITLACNNIWYPKNPLADYGFYVNLKPEDSEKGWMDINVDIPCEYRYDDAFIQFNAVSYSTAGMLIDDITVTRDYDFVGMPSSLFFNDFTADSFTAQWIPGAENKEYIVNLSAKECITSETLNFFENFDEETENGWSVEFASITPDKGVDGSSAAILSEEAYLESPTNYADITSLCFTAIPYGVTKDSETMITFSLYDNEEWKLTRTSIWADELPKDGESMSFELPEGVTQIRIQSHCLDGEAVIIDNIEWSTAGAYTKETVANGMKVAENRIEFTGLDFGKDYYIQVAGVNGDFVSEFTPEEIVRGVAAPKLLNPSDIDNSTASYTANWEMEPMATGYTVDNYMVTTLSGEDNYTVFSDSFNNANSDDGDDAYLSKNDFDGIADNDGWKNLSGQAFMHDYRIGGYVLQSPRLSVQNDNGKFTVSFTVYSYNNAHIAVQSDNLAMIDYVESEFDFASSRYIEGYKDVTMTFSNGKPNTTLLLYTVENTSFSITDFTVTQNVKEGDALYTHLLSKEMDADSSSATFSDLPISETQTYAYTVTSHRLYNDGTEALAETKDMMGVNFNPVSVKSVENVKPVIRANNGVIEVLLTSEDTISVFSAAGAVVANIEGATGLNKIENLPSGVYIVKTSATTAKVLL